ncbi:MAG: hypothetical protein ACI39H_03035 [Lachnospiraceae bacterium]
MRNISIKLSKKLAAVILCASMTCGLLAGCGTDTSTSSTASGNAGAANETTVAETVSSGSGTAEKSETVYVTADPNGNVQEITVSDWLKNPDNYTTINDTTTLQDVVAIKGSEEFSQNGSDLVFTANGNDVYYRGSVPASTTLPVSVNITYTLDGKEIAADALEGVSGHLGMHVQYTNNTTYSATIDGKTKELHVPFLAATMMLVSADKAENLKIDNGKILENNDSDIIIGYGLPGLNDSFGLDEDGVFTDTVDFEADVTDYSPDMMMTFVTSEVFASSDLDEAVDFDSVSESLQEVTELSIKDINNVHSIEDLEDVAEDLKQSCKELDHGAVKIKDGAGELKDGASDLKKNYTTFDSKLALLSDKMTSASDGGAALSNNMKKAAKESKTLTSGAAQVSSGVSALNSSLTGMYQTITTTIADNEKTMAQLKQAMADLTPGSEEYMNYYAQLNQLGGANAALSQIKSQMDAAKLKENLVALSSGAKQVSNGCSALSSGLNRLSTGASDLHSGLSQLSSGAAQLSEASGQIANGTDALYDGTVKLYDGTKELAEGTAQLESAFDGNITPLIDTVKALKDAAREYTTFTSLPDDSKGTVCFVIKTE